MFSRAVHVDTHGTFTLRTYLSGRGSPSTSFQICPLVATGREATDDMGMAAVVLSGATCYKQAK